MNDQNDQELLETIAQEYPDTKREISKLDLQKKPLTKKLNHHRKDLRKFLKRKLDEARAQNPSVGEISKSIGGQNFRLEEIDVVPPCKHDDMANFFSPENIQKYEAATRKKRLKLHEEG